MMIKKIFPISLFAFFSITAPALLATAEDMLDEKKGGCEKTTHVDGIEVLEEGLQILKLTSSARDRFAAHQGPFDSFLTEEDIQALEVLLKDHSSRVLGLNSHILSYKTARSKGPFLKQSYLNQLTSEFIMATAVMCYSYDGFFRKEMISAGAFNSETNSFARVNMDDLKKTYIHPFQRITNGVFEILMNGRRISSSASYGTLEGDSKQALSVFYYTNERGYIPNIFTQLKGTLLLNDTFGDLVDGAYQHLFVFEDGKHNSECGIAVSFRDNPTPFHKHQVSILPVRGGHSDVPYTACPVQMKRFYNDLGALNEDPFNANLMYIFGEEVFREKKTKFFAVPSTPKDVAISELLFLESLMDEAKSEDLAVQESALHLIEIIEDSAEASLVDIMSALEVAIKSDLEQTEVNTARMEGADLTSSSSLKERNTSSSSQKYSKKGAQKKGYKGKKGGHQQSQQKTKATAVAQSSVPSGEEEKAQMRQDRINAVFETVKLEGRAKFGDYLKMINDVKRLFPKDVVARALGSVSKKGSHSNFHALTGKGLTLVRKHGGDSHVPTGKVNSFGLQLIELLVNQMAESATQSQ